MPYGALVKSKWLIDIFLLEHISVILQVDGFFYSPEAAKGCQ